MLTMFAEIAGLAGFSLLMYLAARLELQTLEKMESKMTREEFREWLAESQKEREERRRKLYPSSMLNYD